jgi:hypothetical protein
VSTVKEPEDSVWPPFYEEIYPTVYSTSHEPCRQIQIYTWLQELRGLFTLQQIFTNLTQHVADAPTEMAPLVSSTSAVPTPEAFSSSFFLGMVNIALLLLPCPPIVYPTPAG